MKGTTGRGFPASAAESRNLRLQAASQRSESEHMPKNGDCKDFDEITLGEITTIGVYERRVQMRTAT